ncbi:A24 family peptidase [Photobacterium sp.]|uniref:A24 family peptidase n=1 Tax=Photobacterium sp. TaxID=660 RepID=UPI00299EDB3A|nr:A24 family peptidase [Photobacterium sp.]MDX1302214.1 A24 family peptidase [Photobacterium sp.]
MSLMIISIMIYAALYDLRDCKIPNKAVIAIITVGLVQSAMTTIGLGSIQSISLPDALLGLFVGLLISILLHIVGLFGAGDAKLLAALGAIVGYPNIILLIAMAVLTAGSLAVLRLACYGELLNMLKRWRDVLIYRIYQPSQPNSVAAGAVPMGGAILLATIYCEFYLF